MTSRTAPSSGSTTLVSHAYATHDHQSTPRTSNPFARPAQVGSLDISDVHWVSANTKTRSKKSSSGVTCSLARITGESLACRSGYPSPTAIDLRRCGSRGRTPAPARLGEERQLGFAHSAKHVEVDLRAPTAARGRERDRLRLQHLRSEDPTAGCPRRIDADGFEVAGELLDRLDRPDALDLDRDPALVLVPAHQVDRADGRGPLTPHKAERLADRGRVGGEGLLEVALDAVLLEPRRLPHLVLDVAEDLDQADLEPVLRLPGALAHH